MKLILLRHAKSSWDDFDLDDHDRPLNERGRTSARAIGAWLKTQGHAPEVVACSTASRARETFEIVCAAGSFTPDTTFEGGLYHASPDRVLRQVNKSAPGTLLLVGHNPGFGELAQMLLDHRPEHPEFRRYPTASTLVAEFDVSQWRDAKPGHATLIDFVTPRELPQ